MAKFLAKLLGCTLPSKGASPMFESKSHSRVGLKSSTKQKTTIFSTLASEKSLSDCKKDQQWKPSMYGSMTPICFTSPLIEKPVGKIFFPRIHNSEKSTEADRIFLSGLPRTVCRFETVDFPG
ncbi:uncharacterized protein LOC105065303 isoform X1 [Camelus bactrianus]|nr:uncharacterized protein LOC105065303 [Camelus bactrianus]XP_031288594.1 uncharacterized protein LOC116147178 [Camelus dromedarius]